jgi:hypothetical protein
MTNVVVIPVGEDDAIRLRGVTVAQLQASDFEFVIA